MVENVSSAFSHLAKLGGETEKHEPVLKVALLWVYLTGKKTSLEVFCGIFVGFFIWLGFYLEERYFLFLFIDKCLASACSEQIHAIGDK